MALSEKLLEKLACPACKGKLEYDQKNERLKCHECKLAYRITEDIPVLLTDEAEKI